MSSTDVEQCHKEIEELKKQIAELRDGESEREKFLAENGGDKLQAPRIRLTTRRLLKGHFGKIYAMQWGPASQNSNAQKLVSASQDGKLLVWNAWTTIKLCAVALRSSWVLTCAFSPSGKYVASGGLDNTVSLYKLPDEGSKETTVNNVSAELVHHEGYLSCCRFLSDQEMLTSSGDATLALWDIETRTPKSIFADHAADVMTVVPFESKGIFASASTDGTCKVWDYRQKKGCIRTFTGHEADVNSVSWFPDGNALATGSDDSCLRLFDMRAYSLLNKYQNDKLLCGVTSVDFSSSGRFLFAGYDDYCAYVWDTAKTSIVDELKGHDNRVSALACAPGGKAVCTASWDNNLRVWA